MLEGKQKKHKFRYSFLFFAQAHLSFSPLSLFGGGVVGTGPGGFGGLSEGIVGFSDPGGFSEGIGGFSEGIGGLSEGPGGFSDGIGGLSDGIGGLSEGIGGFIEGPGGFSDPLGLVAGGILNQRWIGIEKVGKLQSFLLSYSSDDTVFPLGTGENNI